MSKFLFYVLSLFFVTSTAYAQSYSENCDDFQAKGHASKEVCLKDGRWHLVYEFNRNAVAYGTADAIQAHAQAGADVKIVMPTQNITGGGSVYVADFNGNELCQQVYKMNSSTGKPVVCLSPLRFSDETIASHGSARYGSDGKVYCNGFNPSSSTSGNLCNADPARIKFYIRY